MRNTKFFFKYLKNITNFINNLLEKNLNKLNFKNLSNLLNNNKIILTFVALIVIFISYLLLPAFYNQSDISKQLRTELQNKFDINFQFSQNISYNFFPKPHFVISETTILDDFTEISKINKSKIYISFTNFFSFKNIKIKDLIFDNANFNLNKNNYKFFYKLINKNFQDGNLTIKNSNVFFRNSSEEVLFVNKIIKIKYYYEPKEFKNIFYSENEIFNIPFSMKTFFNNNKSKIYSQINLDLMNLKIQNILNVDKEKKDGKSELIFNNLKRIAEYQFEKNNFNIKIFDRIDEPNVNYYGKFNFKPFYASFEGDLDEINLNHLLGSRAIIAQLLKTEIFNNKNINFQLNIKADKIYKNFNFKNIHLNSKIQDGLIDLDRTKFEWRNFSNFELLESLIFVKNGELILDGKLKIKVNDYNDIYKFLLTPKKYRNRIDQIDLNFTYNFDQKVAQLKDIRIDNEINHNVNKILNNVILKKDNFQNKIYFKNLLNEAFKSYDG